MQNPLTKENAIFTMGKPSYSEEVIVKKSDRFLIMTNLAEYIAGLATVYSSD